MENIRKFILAVLAAFLLPMVALAQDDISISTGIVGNGRLLGGKTYDSQGTVPMIGVDSSSNTMVNALSGKQVNLTAAKTPVAQFAASGNTLAAGVTVTSGSVTLSSGNLTLTSGNETLTSGNLTLTNGNITQSTGGTYLKQAVYVPTLVATPVAATNYCPGGLCVVPTVAANAALLIGDATPVVGIPYTIKNNNSANLIRAKASGGATINGAVAGGYIGLAAGTSMDCIYLVVGDLTCKNYSTAGGTTAALPTPAGP